MNSGFYITELGKESYFEANKCKSIEPKELKEINDNFTLSDSANDQKMLEKSKHNILDYLIREETNFADLYKVEKYFKNVMIHNSKKYDQNDIIIKRKLKDIEEVQDLINREIIANIDLEKDEMIELYRLEKENLQAKIEKIEHDNECFQHMYERLYKNNYLLKKSINDQLAYDDKYEAQLSQYEIMKNKAYSAYLTRKNLLNKMTSFENMAIIKNEFEIEEMQKLYQELEEQVQLIKSETLEMEYKLNLIEEDVKKKEKKIAEYKLKHVYLIPERNNFIKEYLKENFKIIKIYQTLNVNSLNEIIDIFNNEKFSYQSNYMQFNNLNKETIDLNIIYTTYEKDLQNLEINLKSKDYKDMMSGDYKSDIDVNNLEIVLKESRDSLEEDIDKIAIIEKIFIKLKKNFNNYDKKLSYIINCINYLSALKFKEDNKNNPNVNNINLLKEKSGKTTSTKTINNLVQLKELMPNHNEWNSENIKYFFKYLSRFSSKLFYCLHNYLTTTASDALNKNLININLFIQNKEKSKEFAVIVSLNKKELCIFYEETINIIVEKAQNKKKQTTKSDKDNFLDRQNVEDNKKKEIKQKKSTVTGIFNNFINDQSQFDVKIKKEDLKRSLEFKVLTHVSKFTNDLVDKDFINLNYNTSFTQKNKFLPKIKNSKYNTKTSFTSTERMYDSRVSFKKNENEPHFDSENKNKDDSYFSDTEAENVKKNNVKAKKMNMFGKEKRDVDKFFVYKRMEDLNNLEHKFHQDKDDKLVSSHKFNHRYHNMKRQFFDDIKEKNLMKFDRFTNRETFLKNISNENCNIIIKEKLSNKNFSQKNYIQDLFNENFMKENEKFLLNHLQETKKNFRSTYMDNTSTKYSSNGFFPDGYELKNSITSFKLNETIKIKDSKRFSEMLPHLNKGFQRQNTKSKGNQ